MVNGKKICGELACLKALCYTHEPRHFKEEHTGTNPYYLTISEYTSLPDEDKREIKKQLTLVQSHHKANQKDKPKKNEEQRKDHEEEKKQDKDSDNDEEQTRDKSYVS